MTAPSAPDEQPPDGRIRKPRRSEAWAIVVSSIIVLGLLGHLLNQQRSEPSANSESLQRESTPAPAAAETKTAAGQPSKTPRENTGNSADTGKPLQVMYAVTHKHRLRDCHGTLTFTREGLRFESDEPQDSFAVRRADVTIEGDVLRIRDKMWRFEFEDSIRAERIFQDWKSGFLRTVPPSPGKK